jgi:hypothetical protein
MKGSVLMASLVVALLFGCQQNKGTGSSKDIPEWLQSTIDSISTIEEYEGTTVYRYTWNNEYLYHFEIPMSTCTYCALYNHSGVKVLFTSDSQFHDFLEKKTDGVVLWEWRGKL